jgi:predicted RNase H-like HicB family nuclease
MRKFTYDATFIDDDDDGVIAVLFHDLPGCNTQGRDREQAKERAKEALENWLDTLEYLGVPFPKPSVRNDGKEYIGITAVL